MNQRRWDVADWLLAAAPLWMFPLAWWLTFSPYKAVSWAGLLIAQLELLAVLGFLVAIVYLVFVPALLCFGRHRRRALHNVALAVVFIGCFVGGLVWGRFVRQGELERLPSRAQPLVDAITAYETKNGRPPDSLDELVPDYLSSIPDTGVGYDPRFSYFKLSPDSYRGNAWGLRGPCPSAMSFDYFSYYPRQNYQELGLSRIGNWGYFYD
jgi:hypothetical protein